MLALATKLKAPHKNTRLRSLAASDGANLSSIGGFALTIAAVIVGAVVALILISTLFPTYSGAVKNLSSNVTTADWGNTTANALGPVFGLLISLGGLFAIVGLAFLAYKLKHGKGGNGGI
jgi:hypothetical protein